MLRIMFDNVPVKSKIVIFNYLIKGPWAKFYESDPEYRRKFDEVMELYRQEIADCNEQDDCMLAT